MPAMLERVILTGLRPTRAEISLTALRHNLRSVRELVGPEVAVMGVVKANGYGHGAAEVAAVLASEGAAWLGVALPEEGVILREAGLDVPIFCLGGFWEGQEATLLDFELTPAVSRLEQLVRLDAEAGRRGVTTPVHRKVDPGMGRLGLALDELDTVVAAAGALRHLRIEGLMTHLASSDVPALRSFTESQIAGYGDALEVLASHGLEPRWRHLANG